MGGLMSGSWGRAYWIDLGERTASSAIGGLLTMLTLATLDELTWGYAWAVVGVPAATAFLKGLMVNLGGDTPTASMVDVSSHPDPHVSTDGGADDAAGH